jgi:hypothetical protein
LQLGLYDTDVWITTNCSEPAKPGLSAAAWHEIPIAGSLQISSPLGLRRRGPGALHDTTPWHAVVCGKDGNNTVHTTHG